MRTTKLVPTTQMPSKDRRMQQLPQNRTLRESVPQQNRQGKKTKSQLPILITQRDDIKPLLGVNWLKQLPITIKKILLDEHNCQSNEIHTKLHKLFETNNTIKNAEVKIQLKPGCYLIQQKARPIPCHLQKDVKNKLERLIKSGHLERLETIEEDCFVSPSVITVKKRQDSKNCTRCTQTER